jgi:hypothetical protein
MCICHHFEPDLILAMILLCLQEIFLSLDGANYEHIKNFIVSLIQ